MAKRKNPAAVALGRKGGKKGGKARAANLTAEQLSEIGRMGAAKRWAKSARHSKISQNHDIGLA